MKREQSGHEDRRLRIDVAGELDPERLAHGAPRAVGADHIRGGENVRFAMRGRFHLNGIRRLPDRCDGGGKYNFDVGKRCERRKYDLSVFRLLTLQPIWMIGLALEHGEIEHRAGTGW